MILSYIRGKQLSLALGPLVTRLIPLTCICQQGAPRIWKYVLHQVAIRIPDIHTPKLSSRPGSIDHAAALQHFETFSVELLHHMVYLFVNQETQVATSRLDVLSFRLKFLATDMEIDFLLPESEGVSLNPPGGKGGVSHAQKLFVEFDRRLEVFHREDQMVER